MNWRMQQTFLGMLVGILGNLVGFFLFAGIVMFYHNVDFRVFYEVLYLGSDSFKSNIISGAILVNIVLFFIFMRKRKDELNRGLIVVILFTVMAIVYYYE